MRAPRDVQAASAASAASGAAEPDGGGPSLRGDVTASVLSQGLLLACGLVAGVVTARGLGLQGRGLLALATTIPSVLVVAAGMGAPLAASYLLARGEERLRVLSRAGSLLALSGSAATLTVLAAVSATGWYRALFGTMSQGLLVLACLLVPPMLLQAVLVGLLRGSGRLRTASAVELVQGLVAGVGTVLAVLWLHGGPGSVVLAQLAGILLALSLAGLALRADGLSLRPRASRTVLGRMLGFGLRADLGNVMHVTGFRLDVFLVNGFTGTAALGVYAVATRFAELLFVLPYAISLVVMPRGVRARAQGRADEIPRVFTWTLLTSCAAALALALAAAPLLSLLYGDRYAGAYRPFVILLVGVVAFGATNVLMNDVVGRGHPGLVSVIAAAGLVLTVALDLWLVPAYGITGAAVASTVVYVVDAALAVVCYLRVSGRQLASLFALGTPVAAGAPR